MQSSIRNTSLENTTRPTRSAPVVNRLIQEVTYLSVSCNQTVTRSDVALATNPCTQDDRKLCTTELLLELADQMANQSSTLQFNQAKPYKLYSTKADISLQQFPLLDEMVPITIRCTTTYLGFAPDNSPNRIAVDIDISQGKQACCHVGFWKNTLGKVTQVQSY